MFFVRKLVSICLHHNIHFKAKHIPGIGNRLAHAVSLAGTDFHAVGPSLHRPLPHGGSSASAASALGALVTKLASTSLQPSSLPTYRRAWRLFQQFLDVNFISSTSLPQYSCSVYCLSV